VSQAGGVPKITTALPTWGTPVWFYEEHAPRIFAETRRPASAATALEALRAYADRGGWLTETGERR
jgi:hypothetical protein